MYNWLKDFSSNTKSPNCFIFFLFFFFLSNFSIYVYAYIQAENDINIRWTKIWLFSWSAWPHICISIRMIFFSIVGMCSLMLLSRNGRDKKKTFNQIPFQCKCFHHHHRLNIQCVSVFWWKCFAVFDVFGANFPLTVLNSLCPSEFSFQFFCLFFSRLLILPVSEQTNEPWRDSEWCAIDCWNVKKIKTYIVDRSTNNL